MKATTFEIYLIFLVAFIAIASFYLNYQNAQKVNEPEQNSLGIATKAGCLKTTFTDDELVKNKILIEKVIGVQTADLCYLNG